MMLARTNGRTAVHNNMRSFYKKTIRKEKIVVQVFLEVCTCRKVRPDPWQNLCASQPTSLTQPYPLQNSRLLHLLLGGGKPRKNHGATPCFKTPWLPIFWRGMDVLLGICFDVLQPLKLRLTQQVYNVSLAF